MADDRFILALDQGTTSSRAILFDRSGMAVASAQQEFEQHFPRPGWVEHEPEAIWESQYQCARDVLHQHGISASQVEAIGITNQRETALAWDRQSGEALGRAIVWQDRRTADRCAQWKQQEREGMPMERWFQNKTGLFLDPYFSGSKWAWMWENRPALRDAAAADRLCLGTVDAWLLFKLSGGRTHATDASNASRTLLYDIDEGAWSRDCIEALGLPGDAVLAALPEVRDSSGDFGSTDPCLFDGQAMPIRGVAGDQQAALFGQACFAPGMAKNTYGTGCFLLWQTGPERRRSEKGLLSTVAWQRNGIRHYALEGSVFVAGAAIQWLRDGLQLIDQASDSAALAESIPDTGGVVVVPAFAGLGAPHWDPYARGGIFGLTRGTGKAELVRATLEALAYQSHDLVGAMRQDAGMELRELRVDGGAAANNFLMQFQADLLGLPVLRPAFLESTAAGAAYLAGLTQGFYDQNGIEAAVARGSEAVPQKAQTPEGGGGASDAALPEAAATAPGARRFLPRMDAGHRKALLKQWDRAVERCKAWEDPGADA
jgi:glycerol kinase